MLVQHRFSSLHWLMNFQDTASSLLPQTIFTPLPTVFSFMVLILAFIYLNLSSRWFNFSATSLGLNIPCERYILRVSFLIIYQNFVVTFRLLTAICQKFLLLLKQIRFLHSTFIVFLVFLARAISLPLYVSPSSVW